MLEKLTRFFRSLSPDESILEGVLMFFLFVNGAIAAAIATVLVFLLLVAVFFAAF